MMSNPDAIFDRRLLVQRRNRAAPNAANHDFLLHRVSEDLSDRLKMINRFFAKTLVLGAHHGVVERHLAELESLDWIVSAEQAPDLLAHCMGPKIAADEEWLPIKDGALDLVVAALNFQFVNDLPGVLVQIRRALKNDGLLLAAVLGGATLTELRQAWLQAEAEVTGGVSPRVAPFADIRDMGTLLQRAGFALPVVDSERITVTYGSPLDLMREIKGMGASNCLTEKRKTPVNKTLLARAAQIYAEQFSIAQTGRVKATFEILMLSAWAPDASQQKPLKPGSAKMRLADALGVPEGRITVENEK